MNTANSVPTTNGNASGQPGYPATYQEYYQQYMQYMYSMNMYQGNYQAAAMSTTTASTYPQMQTTATTALPPPPPPPESPQAQQAKQAAIKINLKFQQQQQPKLLIPQIKPTTTTEPVRKSRFDSTASGTTTTTTPNVAKQQNLYQQYQQKQREKLAAAAAASSSSFATTTTSMTVSTSTSLTSLSTSNVTVAQKTTVDSSTTANDIISDINKWPTSLKNYCSRLFQIYHSNKLVSEQQVTRYLQMRITEAFKIKSDLSINWDSEKIPDVQTIKEFITQDDIKQKKAQIQQRVGGNVSTTAATAASYNQVPPPQPLLSIQTKATPATFRFMKQQQQQQQQYQQQVSNKRKSKSPSSDKSSTSSSTSSSNGVGMATPNKKLKKEQQPKIVKSKLRRNLSEEDDDDYDDDEDGYESESETEERMSDEDFKPFSSKLKKKQKNAKGGRNVVTAAHSHKLNQRVQRFHVEVKNEPFKRKINRTISLFEKGSINDLTQARIIGTSQDLEKEYLRLTGPPEPCNVRPLHVLKKSLDYILEKYTKTNDYRYVCDQLKAIRQDLTVQMIRNEFTIQVYETHARLAIMKADRDALNQCQTQLINLYETVQDKKASENAPEFIGYRLLYYILTKSHKDLNRVIIEIKRKYNDITYLKHLLKFRLAWHMNNYVMLFKLYKKSNQMSKYLIDLFIERERKLALKMIIKAYRPNIKLEYIKELLAYDSINKCKEDLIAYGLCINTIVETTNENEKIEQNCLVLDCKSSNIQNL